MICALISRQDKSLLLIRGHILMLSQMVCEAIRIKDISIKGQMLTRRNK